MTYTRRIAVKIADWVVQLASPGCRDWAEGLAREVASIYSDRSALRWAVGGLRILLDRRNCPILSFAQVPAAAQEYLTRRRRELTRQVWLCIVIALEFIWIWHVGQVYRPAPQIVGSLVLFQAIRSDIPAIVAALMLFHTVRGALFLQAMPPLHADPPLCASVYRGQLVRDIRFTAGWINLLSVMALNVRIDQDVAGNPARCHALRPTGARRGPYPGYWPLCLHESSQASVTCPRVGSASCERMTTGPSYAPDCLRFMCPRTSRRHIYLRIALI